MNNPNAVFLAPPAQIDYCPLCGAHPHEQGEGQEIQPIAEHWVEGIKMLYQKLVDEGRI